mmetsp:Transcript_49574/g.59693  ORF Transcript_49574/g.59693 Transcript_49574/m.59693 type:complete len:179 (+) Transcript_49574:131-667(+)
MNMKNVCFKECDLVSKANHAHKCTVRFSNPPVSRQGFVPEEESSTHKSDVPGVEEDVFDEVGMKRRNHETNISQRIRLNNNKSIAIDHHKLAPNTIDRGIDEVNYQIMQKIELELRNSLLPQAHIVVTKAATKNRFCCWKKRSPFPGGRLNMKTRLVRLNKSNAAERQKSRILKFNQL